MTAQKHWNSYESLEWGKVVISLEKHLSDIFQAAGFSPAPDLLMDLAEVYAEFKKYGYLINVLLSNEVATSDDLLDILVGVREQVLVGQVHYHAHDAEPFLEETIEFFIGKGAIDLDSNISFTVGKEEITGVHELFGRVAAKIRSLGIPSIPKGLTSLLIKIYGELNRYTQLIDELLDMHKSNKQEMGRIFIECYSCLRLLENDVNRVKKPINKLINSL